MGMVIAKVQITPAVTAACLPEISFLALDFAIRRETVTGTPLDATVKNTENTVRQI